MKTEVLAAIVLAIHLAVIAFNLFGLLIVPLGGWKRWRFVHAPLWRLLHLASLGLVALQSAIGQPCFLTVWQAALEGMADNRTPLIMRWVNATIFWPLPMWAFEMIYVAVFLYALALLWFVPLRRRNR